MNRKLQHTISLSAAFDTSDRLAVPGDSNTQRPELMFCEGPSVVGVLALVLERSMITMESLKP